MRYRFLEHMGDVRAECKGATFAELLEAASRAMYGVAFRRMEDRIETRRSISVEANGAEEAVVRWLQELIYLMEAEQFVAILFRFTQANAHSVSAEVEGYKYEPEDREDEIKAATYHGMNVEHHENGWRAEVIFDL